MSEIAKAKELEKLIDSFNKEIEKLKNDEKLKRKLSELEKFAKIMEENDITRNDLASYFGMPIPDKPKKRIRRESKNEWVNPHTGEIFVGVRRTGKLKEWIEQYGFEEVESWKRTV